MDIRASNNIVHIWTCSDSCYALMELINYLSSDGDFAGSSDVKQPSRAETPVSVVSATSYRILVILKIVIEILEYYFLVCLLVFAVCHLFVT